LRAFAAGVAVGLVLAGATVGGALSVLVKRGLQVPVATDRLAAQVRVEVEAAARRELPGAIATVRRDLPRRAADEAARRLRETRLEVAGLQVPVPEAVTRQVSARMEEAVRLGIDLAIRDADLDALAGRIGQRAYVLVDERMRSSLTGQQFVVKPWPWLSVPVRLVPSE
jgi:hypothetical protein